jgi:hypothetical protein
MLLMKPATERAVNAPREKPVSTISSPPIQLAQMKV